MKLYLIGLTEQGLDKMPCADHAQGFVIRASSPRAARKIAAANKGDEEESVWLDPKYSTCSELKTEGKAEVILRDYYGT